MNDDKEIKETKDGSSTESLFEKMFNGLDITSFESQLKALPLGELMQLAKDAEKASDGRDIPDTVKSAVEAVAKELHCRTDAMKQEAEDLNRQIDALHKEIKEKDREYLDLLHQKHWLELQVAQQRHKLRERESTGFYQVRRNDPCPCGSGKKYKHCCGK